MRGAFGELLGEVGEGAVVFGHEDAAAGVLIETVHDAGAERVATGGHGAAVVEDGVDQRALPMPGGGVDDEPGGFVEAEQVIVLIENVERDILGLNVGGSDGLGRNLCVDAVAFPHGIGSAGGVAIDADESSGERFLPAGAAELRPLFGQPAVEARGSEVGGAVKYFVHGM